MSVSGIPVTPEARAALEELLRSRAFRRSDQLKKLLSYLVEQQEAGRAHEVTEYELGTKALGRPVEFAPETDSSVRTRMHSLRQKLEEYYREEGAGARIRIELPRGGYWPQFVELEGSPELIPAVTEQPVSRRNWLWGAASVGALGLAAVAARRAGLGVGKTPLERLWAPIVDSPQTPAIVVGQPLHLWVRDVRGEEAEAEQYPHLPDAVPNSPMFQEFIRPRVNPGAKLKLHPSPNATLWGDAAGGAAAVRFLAFRGKNADLFPESTLKSEVALKGRPVLLLGRPEFSVAIQRLLLRLKGYTVGIRNDLRQYAIYHQGKPEDHFLNTRAPNELNHGLVSVLEDGGARVMVFSGITSDGSMAGMDYLTNAESVAKLWALLEKDGLREWPRAFQVVVRVSSSSGYAMGVEYRKHIVLG